MSERERAEGPLAQFWTRSVQNSRTLLIRTGSFFLKWLYIFFYLCHRKRNAYNLRTRHRRELWFTAFCRPKPCGGKVFFSDFWKCARGRAEGRKTVFTVPSLNRERFDVESSTLRHFVAQQNPHPTSYSDLTYCASVRAEGPLFDFRYRNWNAYNSRTRYRTEFGFAAFYRPKPCGVQVFFRFWKMCARAGRRPNYCFYITLFNSKTVWRRMFNFAPFCSLK